MALSQRPYAPGPNLPGVESVIAQSVQGQGPGPLPALQIITSTAETLIVNPAQPTLPLSCAIPPNTNNEQVPIDLNWSGDIQTSESGNITLKVYCAPPNVPLDLDDGVGIGSSGALAGPTGGGAAPFYVSGKLIFDSIAGTLQGTIKFFYNQHLVAEVAISNAAELVGISNTADPVAQFFVSVQATASDSDNPVNVNTQNLSVG